MPRRDAAAVIEQRGGTACDETPEWVVVGEESSSEQQDEANLAASESGALLLPESEFWRRIGVVEDNHEVHRLYTPAMLADLAGVPLAAVRRWERRGMLRATRRVNRLSFFDFAEARIATVLAGLLEAGRSLSSIDRVVDTLRGEYPEIERPLRELPLVVEDGALLVRQGATLTETEGQRRFDFEAAEEPTEAVGEVLSIVLDDDGSNSGDRELAQDLSDKGELLVAIETLRVAMLSSPVVAEDHFTLAEWLYEAGQPQAARERYYAALELDQGHSEARVSLGCVCLELGDLDLALSAFRGVLETHTDNADAHYHLARIHDRRDESAKAENHWRRFLEVAPDGPWSDEARRRLDGLG